MKAKLWLFFLVHWHYLQAKLHAGLSVETSLLIGGWRERFSILDRPSGCSQAD